MTTIQMRRDTSTNWTTVNPVLASGELGVETDTNKFKIGDGTTVWSNLNYQGSITSSDVTTALGYTPYNSTNPSGYVAINDVLTTIFPVGAIYTTTDYNNGVCPLQTLFTSTWTLLSSTIVTSVGSTTSQALTVSVKGTGKTLGLYSNSGNAGLGVGSNNQLYGSDNLDANVGTTSGSTKLKQAGGIAGVVTDATKSGLTGNVTVPALTPSTTTQTVYLFQRTA